MSPGRPSHQQLLTEIDALEGRLDQMAGSLARQRELEHGLRESEELHRVTLDSISDAVFITDARGAFTFICPNVHVIFGYSYEQVRALRNIESLLGPVLPDAAELDRRGEIENLEVEIVDAEGRNHSLMVNIKRVSIQGGTALYSCRDVTEHKRLEDQLHAAAAEASLAEQRERRSLARDLHDDLGQLLSLASMKLAALREPAVGHEARVREVEGIIGEAYDRTSSLSFQLSPPVLDDMGFPAAAEWLAEDLGERYGLRISVDDDGEPKPLDEATRVVLFRALRELLINVAKHARTEEARVSLRRSNGGLTVAVDDSGVGFDPMAPARGFGLLSIRERLRHLGGGLRLETEPGRGARVELSAPVATGAGGAAGGSA